MDDDAVRHGDGWALARLDDLGEGPGFRKVRAALGVTAFGVNAVVLPPRYVPHFHAHEVQEELYFVHAGRVAFEFGDGERLEAGPGTVVRVSPATSRRVANAGDEEAVLFVVGGKDGYVGRDARVTGDAQAPSQPATPDA
jgi:mannose-6-phosphate isomerase-like protein (cupin superfamily)